MSKMVRQRRRKFVWECFFTKGKKVIFRNGFKEIFKGLNHKIDFKKELWRKKWVLGNQKK